MSYTSHQLHLYVVSELIHNEYYKDILLQIGELLVYLDIFKVMKHNLTFMEAQTKKSIEDELITHIKSLSSITSDVEYIYELARQLI
jgi:hypothetical protein